MLVLPDIFKGLKYISIYDLKDTSHDIEGNVIYKICVSGSNDESVLKNCIERFDNWNFATGFVWESDIIGQPLYVISRELDRFTCSSTNKLILIDYSTKQMETGCTHDDIEKLRVRLQKMLELNDVSITTLYAEHGEVLNTKMTIFTKTL